MIMRRENMTKAQQVRMRRLQEYDEAINARKEAEIKYYGEFRYKEED